MSEDYLTPKPLHPSLYNQWLSQYRKKQKTWEKVLRKAKYMSQNKVDKIAKQYHEEVFAELDCMQCANCCKTISPPFTATDIDRIAKYLKISPTQLIEKYLRLDEDKDYILQTQPCPFLLPDNVCQIYTHRPEACANYPHTHKPNFSSRRGLHLNNNLYCPAVFHILERLNQVLMRIST